MMSIRRVSPHSAEGPDMAILGQLFFNRGPKWAITCGDCGTTFQERLPLVDEPEIPCPHCQAVNMIPVTWESDSP